MAAPSEPVLPIEVDPTTGFLRVRGNAVSRRDFLKSGSPVLAIAGIGLGILGLASPKQAKATDQAFIDAYVQKNPTVTQTIQPPSPTASNFDIVKILTADSGFFGADTFGLKMGIKGDSSGVEWQMGFDTGRLPFLKAKLPLGAAAQLMTAKTSDGFDHHLLVFTEGTPSTVQIAEDPDNLFLAGTTFEVVPAQLGSGATLIASATPSGGANPSTTLALGGHRHAVSLATLADLQDVAAAESLGVATTFNRGDHRHAHGSGYLPDAHHALLHDHTTGDGSGVLTNDEHDGYEELAEIVAPATPAANKLRLYAKDSAGVSKLFYKQDDGVEVGPLAAAGGAGEANTISFMVYFSKTKTNIGTAYVDIYNSLEPDELFNVIDFSNFADFRIIFIWDYVGAGTQQVRWVDRANNANVLWESATFTADQDGTDSGWTVLPAWATGEKQIEWQGKSTTATDDPIAKGYILLLR